LRVREIGKDFLGRRNDNVLALGHGVPRRLIAASAAAVELRFAGPADAFSLRRMMGKSHLPDKRRCPHGGMQRVFDLIPRNEVSFDLQRSCRAIW
jgi:hypothetical protein